MFDLFPSEVIPIFKLCDICVKKNNDKLKRPYSLEYLALQVTLNQYAKNELSVNIFEKINCPSKWKNWYFTYHSELINYRSKSMLLNVHEIIQVISKTALNYAELQPDERGLKLYCKYCYERRCLDCGVISTKRWLYHRTGHFLHCSENY